MNHSSYGETNDLWSKVSALSPNALSMLVHLSSHPDGLTTRQMAEYVGISRSPALKHAERLVQGSLSEREAIPHRNRKMPPTYKYRLASNIDRKELLQIIQALPSTQKKAIKKNGQPLNAQKPTIAATSKDIPDIFQKLPNQPRA